MRQGVQRIKYIIADFISALAAMIMFDLFRFYYLAEPEFKELDEYFSHPPVLAGLLGAPLFWLVVHFYSGYYNRPLQISRLAELILTAKDTLAGVVILFFIMVLNDSIPSLWLFYTLISLHFALQFGCTYSARLLITSQTSRLVHDGTLGQNTLIVGTGENARKLYSDLRSMPRSLGYRVMGFIEAEAAENRVGSNKIRGTLDTIGNIVRDYEIEELLIALDTENKEMVFDVINRLYAQFLPIRMVANRYDILMGSVHMDTIYGKPLVNITPERMKPSTANIKRTLDIVISGLLLILFVPLLAVVSAILKLSSRGPVLYSQERIGLKGRKFKIYKFRTMREDAEAEGPQLSSNNDQRVIPVGRFLRKYRIDELPQLYNVIRGEMSLIGPRPEREYFIQRIVEQAPYFYQLLTVRPGITSWGMVKFGYANSVEKMVERSLFDLIYLRNASLPVDAKIVIYTLQTIITGKGV